MAMPSLAIVATLILRLFDAVGASGDAEWSWPVEPPRHVLRAFVGPPKPWMPGHRGVDIAAPVGELLAPDDGVVHFVGRVVDRDVLSIDHGDGILSSYEPVVATVAEGESVRRGQPIGVVSSGHCATRCVHMGVRLYGEYRNPLLLLGGSEWPVLLPTRAG